MKLPASPPGPENVAHGQAPNRFFVVAHTHWDREWYRPFEHFRLWLGRAVDGVIGTLERDPAFSSFTLDGQAIVLEDYVDVRPENEGRLRALLQDGRIEIGPSYILPDELLVGAEPLIRNLLMGREVCQRFGVAPAAVGYLPDSFGHPLQLPQVLAGFGIDSLIFSRGMGDELDQLGVMFRWRAPDGSEVVAIQQLPHYGNFAGLADADDGERRVRGILEQFGPALRRAGITDVLLCNGSDHHAIQPALPTICEELGQRFAPSAFTISTYQDYARAVGGLELPSWSGELLGSRLQNVLRGVNSSRLYLKRANELAERRLLAVETLAALAALDRGEQFPRAEFGLAWRDLLRNHPHDSICGCSCDEVHRDMLVRYESLHRTLWQLGRWAVERLPTSDTVAHPATVVNPLPQRRGGLLELAGAEPQIVELGGFEARTVELVSARVIQPRPGTSIESDRLRLEVAQDGSLTLTDKASGRRHERLHAFEDEPDMGDLYNFCPVAGATTWRGEEAQARILADGPLVWELELRVQATLPAGLDCPPGETASVSIVTAARLTRGSSRVEFRTTVDNQARDHRLRVVFPVGTTAAAGPAGGSQPVRAESAFALVHRPIRPPEPWTEWTEPPDPTQHTLGVVALGPLALLTKGLPEYEARPGGTQGATGDELCLTLLRCVGVISRPTGAIATRPLGAGPGVPTPEGQCLGRHEFEYALRSDADQLDDLELLRESQDYRCGFLVFEATASSLEAPLALEGDVVFSCLKGAQDGDGLILRCFNPAGSPATGRVLAPQGLDRQPSVSRTRLDETGDEPLIDGVFELRPGQIGTLRLRRN